MKKFIIGLLVLGGLLSAYTPEKTYTFQSGGLIKASELNQNEDDFFNALTDGQADLTAGTVQATTYNYTTAITQYQYITYVAFKGAVYTVSTNYTGIFSSTGNAKAKAQVLLPQGAIITALGGTVSATGLTLNLVTQALSTSNTTTLASVSAITPNLTLTSPHTVDNSTYMYLISCDNFSTTPVLYRAKLTYTVSSPEGTY